MLILLLPFKMNCKVIQLSVWDVSKNDYTNTCISFDEGHSYKTRFGIAPRLSELLTEKRKYKTKTWCVRYRAEAGILSGGAAHLEVELNTLIPKDWICSSNRAPLIPVK